jgi:hypothetical protein
MYRRNVAVPLMTDVDVPPVQRPRRLLLALVVIVPLLVIGAALIHPGAVFCDGPYPYWAGDPCGSNWTNPSLLDYLWPPEQGFAPQSSGLMNELLP